MGFLSDALLITFIVEYSIINGLKLQHPYEFKLLKNYEFMSYFLSNILSHNSKHSIRLFIQYIVFFGRQNMKV